MLSAQSEDHETLFLEGLRERSYYDTAVEYLNELEKSSRISPEFRQTIELQRGITLQQMGAAARVPEDREQHLGQAEAAFRKFIAANPQHEMAAFANSSLGELLFERARTLIWQTESPSNADRKAELQGAARKLIDDAEGIYKKAFDLYESQYKSFPTFIDEAREPEQFQARKDAEARYLRAWFQLSRCTYERGQTYEAGSKERNETLIRASELFEEIHTSRRTNVIGQNARLMMGKCFQEQGDIGRALGIYNEMKDHRSDHPAVRDLKSIALHYRLICLNDPQKSDHQVVLKEASEWLQENRSKIATPTGLGILWEKALAEEKLAEDRSGDPKNREVLLRQAMEDAQSVGRYPGAFREPANALSRRIKAALGDKDKEPRDFETAFERARGMIDEIERLKGEAANATGAERETKQNALDLHINEVGRLLRLALDLREDTTDAKAVAQARYLLSFVYFRQRKNFDAIIMSSYCMTKDAIADPDTALNATEIAISAAVQAWNDAPPNDRDFETTLIRDVCLEILKLYPQSARGNEARIRLGLVYQQLENPMEAAKWFLQVPQNDPKYASARISAGQSFWAAYARQSAEEETKDPLDRRNPDDLKKLREEAMALLADGVKISRTAGGENVKPSDEVVAAEVSLASILNLEGRFQETIKRLTDGGENAVVSLISVAEGTTRPAKGIKSQSFAGLTYRLLLRAYVGTQQIDQAIATMALLEKTGGQDITAVYTQLGQELQEELKRLKAANETQRLNEVRSSFEKFLEKVYAQRNQSDYNSLLWIGETYFGLGQGVSEDVAAAAAYYDKAATAYNEILTGNLTQEPTTTAINLRLARCRRQQLQFQDALEITKTILLQNDLALDAQFEAARILSDWGANGEPAKLLEAIQGVKKDGSDDLLIWGWSNIARRLQQTLSRTSADDSNVDFKDRFLEARWEVSNCRRRYAASGAADAQEQLKSALAEITIFVEVFRDIDNSWWAKFDRLYQDIQADLGELPKPLARPVTVAPVEPDPVPTPQDSPSNSTTAKTDAATADAGGSGILLPLIGVCLAAGLAAAFYFLLNKPKKRVRTTFSSPGNNAFPTIGGGDGGIPDLSNLSSGGTKSPRAKTSEKAAAPRPKQTPSVPKPSSASSENSPVAGAKPVRRPPTTSGQVSSGVPSAQPKAAQKPAEPRNPSSGAKRPVEKASPRPAAEKPAPPGRPAPGQPTAQPAKKRPNPPDVSPPATNGGNAPRPKPSGQPPAKRPPSSSASEGKPSPSPGTRPKPPAANETKPARRPKPPEQ
ncbi:MAG: hypothetical protein R3C20_16575 [Planctomycetaceae bacterium]